MNVMSEMQFNIQRNLEIVQENITQATKRVGRSQEHVHLLVVTKTHSVDTIRWVIEAGAKHLGENYMEEGREKILVVKTEGDCYWHMIGHVQSRKSNQVVEYFDYVHSLDSMRLALRLNTHASSLNKVLPVFLEFNLSGEESKSGWRTGIDDKWNALLPEIDTIMHLPNLRVCGLMTIPPFFENPEDARPYFRKLNHLRAYLMKQLKISELLDLSMGMSGDYEVAIEEGATWVRIGQAILGPRLP